MDAVVIRASDLDGEPRLELAQGEDGTTLGIVVAAHRHVREGGARQQMDGAHQRFDQPFDVTTEARGRRWAIL